MLLSMVASHPFGSEGGRGGWWWGVGICLHPLGLGEWVTCPICLRLHSLEMNETMTIMSSDFALAHESEIVSLLTLVIGTHGLES